MKKLLLFTLFLTSITSIGQTIVNTTVEDKKVVLEEFTGMHCVFCPQGHAISQAIQDNNPGNVFLINIHTGSFAVPGNGEPDFRTPFGPSFAAQSGLVGYPAGTVNRHNFPGQEQGNPGTTAMSRNQWTSASNQVLGQTSNVNVGVEADINVSTNELIVHVEAYYTGNSPEGSNFLNVALLQNNTLGPQTGGNMGNNYVHMHRLVDMITGQWGIEIPTTTTGTFVDQTFTYPIPTDYNEIPVEITDLEVVAYITETHQEIASGSGAYPTFSGFANANDAEARYIVEIDDQCGIPFAPQVNIQNVGENDITALTLEYSVNGGATETYEWTGSLTSLQDETVTLPEVSYSIGATNTVEVSIQDGDDDNNANNTTDTTFDNAIQAVGLVTMILNTDNAGSQCTWEVINSAGDLVYSGGPYGNNQSIVEDFTFDADCYRYSLYDSAGNGGGSFVLHDEANNVLASSPGDYNEGLSVNFNADTQLGLNDNILQNINIYPNPASSVLNISNAENANIEVYDLLGKLILSKTNISFNEQINVSKFQSGTYFVKIEKENQVSTERFIVNK